MLRQVGYLAIQKLSNRGNKTVSYFAPQCIPLMEQF